MSKSLVCSCEDVTAEDIREAVARGHRDVESVKRYTGLGTGICQGKSCMASAAGLLRELEGLGSDALEPFTPRPPAAPVPLGLLASAEGLSAHGPPLPGVPPVIEPAVPPFRPREPVPEKADVVIIGGGIMGLALAYNLALRGVTDVVVLEKGYLCAGASGRNGGGVRMQWTSPTHIALARRSIELCKRFARDLGIHVWLRQGGYLFLAPTAEGARRLEKSVALHHRYGVPTQLITPDAARDIVPQLEVKGLVAASFNPEDGVIFPWPFLWGYANGCARHGVKVQTFTQVTGFELGEGRVVKVLTDRGPIRCGRVVNAAGAWSKELAALASVELPNEPRRHEILVTEPLKPFLDPLVSVLETGLYFSQSTRGEIVGGLGNPEEPVALEQGSTFKFLTRFAAALVERMPVLGSVKVLRQWAGCYDVTPDNAPILGETPGLPNLLQMNGFVGHGFMMAPAMAERMAAWMCGEPDEIFQRFNLSRFAEGRLEREDFIIG